MIAFQAATVFGIVLCVTVLTALHDIAGSIAAPIFTAALSGTLGYVGGRHAVNGS
jgi:hypothetical protein